MARQQTHGYIVVDRVSGPCGLTEYTNGIVLCNGGTVQVFESRKHAQEAICRTAEYAREHEMPWSLRYDIVRLVAGGRLMERL